MKSKKIKRCKRHKWEQLLESVSTMDGDSKVVSYCERPWCDAAKVIVKG